MSLLAVRGLCKTFGGIRAVVNVGFELEAGEMVAMIGPNGAGKSTCFNIINGQLRPDSGTIRFKGETLTGRSPRQIWRLGVGRTFQITATFRSMTVRENVQMALISRHRQLLSMWRVAQTLHLEAATRLLELVGVADQAERPCGVLAYGDLKKVELAVALAHAPDLLLMDEPTAGMAPKERVELMALTASIVRDRGCAVLFTEHDMDVVFAHADRIIVLNRGEMIALGKPDEVRSNGRVQEVYLGSAGPLPSRRRS